MSKHLYDFLNYPIGTFTNSPEFKRALNKVLCCTNSGGGGIQSIVAGTNITVDDTDPLNPVISATGGGGGLTGSGTNNTLTKWTGTSSLGNSLVSEDVTTVKIGAVGSQPTYAFGVYGTTNGVTISANQNALNVEAGNLSIVPALTVSRSNTSADIAKFTAPLGNEVTITSTGLIKATGLAGVGTRMVVADSTGLLGFQAIPGGGGDVTGGASSTDNAVAIYNGITGKVIKNSAIITDASGNIRANNFVGGYTTTATAAGTTTLTVSSTILQYFTGVTTQTVVLPVVSTLTLGHPFTIVNNSTGLVTVNSSGANNVVILAAGTTAYITCILTSGTTAASWSVDYSGAVVATGKKATFSNTMTFAGTDAQTYTFPTTSKTLAANDGSNWTIASQAIGDLPIASSTTAYGRLADVATGNALISGGVGVAPSYGKIGLTTHVSGTLPIANGGTNATSVTVAPVATAFAGWDANKNLSANNMLEAYTTTATAAGTTTLTVGSTKQQVFTGTTTQTVVLPVATTLVNGFQFVITNNSTGVVTVNTSGAALVVAMAANTNLYLTCVNTAGGTGTASWNWSYQTNNNTSIIGGSISGLTTNYIPVATSSTAIGNSVMAQNGANIGVGTTSASAYLEAVGNGNSIAGGYSNCVSAVSGNFPAMSLKETGSGSGFGWFWGMGADRKMRFSPFVNPKNESYIFGSTGIAHGLAIENSADLTGVLLTNTITYKNWQIWNTGTASSPFTPQGSLNIYGGDIGYAMIITKDGRIILGNNGTFDDGTNRLQVDGSVKATQYRLSDLNTAPSSATDTGVKGEIRVTATYIYICTATNTWVRTALSTF